MHNSSVDCSAPSARYVATFSISDGATVQPPVPATALIVKALSAEMRLLNLGPSVSTACAAITLTPVTPTSGGTHDPSSSADSEYLGVEPTVTAAPKVIDGVVQ